MADIRINRVATLEAVTMDWLLGADGLLDETEALASAVTVALGTDRLALAEDELPGLDDVNRRGWWGDMDAGEVWDGWPIGSRLWLLERAKIVGQPAKGGATTFRVEQYVLEAMQPFVEKGVCSRYEVRAYKVDTQRIDVDLKIYRGPLPAIELRYQSLWDEIKAG